MSDKKQILTEAEKELINAVLYITPEVKTVQATIKENFGLNSTFDETTNTLHIKGNAINEAFQIANAKEYAVNTIGAGVLDVVFD
jgi:hypothetical protein